MPSPFFEIILPSCNRPRLLKRAVASALAQTYQNFRLWVLDMSSPENWERIQKDWNDHIFRGTHTIRHFDTPKGVVPYSWMTNQIWGVLKEDSWVSYLTDDAYYPADRLEIFAEEIGAHPEIEALYGQQIRINCGAKKFPVGEHVKFMVARSVDKKELAEHNWIDHNALVHKVDLLKEEKTPWVIELKWIKVGDWKCWHKIIEKTDISYVKRVVAFDEWWPNGLSESSDLQLKEKFGAL
jgi:hypothetical protein